MCRKTTNSTFFNNNKQFVMHRQLFEQRMVQRFGKTGVSHRGGKTLGVQFVRRTESCLQSGAKGKDGDAASLLDDAALTNVQDCAAFRHVCAHTISTRIAEADWSFVIGRCCPHHVFEFGFIAGRHHYHVGKGGQVGGIESTTMGRAIGPYKSGAINGKSNRQVLQGHIMHNLIICTL